MTYHEYKSGRTLQLASTRYDDVVALADRHGISIRNARKIVAGHGLDRAICDSAVARLKAEAVKLSRGVTDRSSGR